MALAPAVRLWLDGVANVRIHGETRKRPVDMLVEEQPHLQPLPANLYDIGTVAQVRANSQFRVTLDTNRYSAPSCYAGARLTMKIYPDRLCLYHEAALITRHTRSYEKHRDFEEPDHARELVAQRKKGDDQKRFLKFLAISPRAITYFNELKARHLNVDHHLRKILAMADIYGKEAVTRAMDDALELHVASADYIVNILECRTRKLREPGPLHLTRRSDLLEITIQGPGLSVYDLQPASKKENLS
jgi:hypothetical protein